MEDLCKYFLIAPPEKGAKYTHWEKVRNFFLFKTRHVTHQNLCHDPRNSDLMFFFQFNILNIRNIAKNVILGVNNTPNLPLKLVYFFCFWSYRPAKYVKLTNILFSIKFQLWTIFFKTITMSNKDFSTFGAILGGRGLRKKLSTTLKWTLPVWVILG